MLPGISGSLVTTSFAKESLGAAFAGRLGERSKQAGVRGLTRWARRVARSLGPASSDRVVLDLAVLPLLEMLGYEVDVFERRPGAGGFIGRMKHRGMPVATALVLPWTMGVETAWREAVNAGLAVDSRWTLAVNGRQLALVDSGRTWSRRMLLVDLEVALGHEASAALVWALARAEAVADDDAGKSLLERVAMASDGHAVRVCSSLGNGVLDALRALVDGLDHERRRTDDRTLFDQALTIVYRVLFLLFAEARSLVPAWHRVYADAYTIDSLCRRAIERSRPTGLWDGLQAIARLLHDGCEAGDLRVTPFNGRLFAPAHAPLASRVRVPDRLAARALLALATGPEKGVRRGGSSDAGRRRIAYADLGVEQLGAVYERVLEYETVRTNGRLALERTSAARKATGSFYTPRSLTDFLVRRTLYPLVSRRSAADILSLRIVDPAMGSGAFLVSACRYLAEAVERALIDEGAWHAGDVGEAERAGIRRQVAERCLYGVDINPTAVQVARLSLWLHTLAADRPLSFLDHHLATGDSLVGARLTDLSRQFGAARRVRRPAPMLELFDREAALALSSAVPERFALALQDSDTLSGVREKERRLGLLESSSGPLARWKIVGDLWCAAWFREDPRLSPQVVGELTAQLLGRTSALPARHAESLLGVVSAFARRQRPLHWELTFPEVFFHETGERRADAGFDAVLGNPPWDVIRADAGRAGERMLARRSTGALVRFLRDAGIYALSGTGHPNQYQLFLERSWQLVRPGGRFGLILPSGLAADHGSAHLRRALLTTTSVDTLFGFDNRRAIFPIHRSTRFLLVAGSHAGDTSRLRCRFGLDDVSYLDRLADSPRDDPADAYPVCLDRSLLERWDPRTLSIPELADPRAVSILAGVAARVPALGDAAGWQARFGRELNATDDNVHFVARPIGDAGLLPIVEGKHLEPFRVSVGSTAQAIARVRASDLIDPATSFERPRLAYRDVSGRTNRLTLIAAILPAGVLSTHTVFCLKSSLDEASSRVLLALVNSLVANYLARLYVTTHVTTAIISRLPVPRPQPGSPVARRLEALARRLQASGIDGDIDAYAALNALVAGLYELTPDEYVHIVGTFPLLSEELRARCIRAFSKAAAETQRHREERK